MRDLYDDKKKTHKEILENLLWERKLKKSDFALQIGYTKTNYTRDLNADMYTQKTIKKICRALDIDTSVFDLSNTVISVQIAPALSKGDKALYESVIAALKSENAALKQMLEMLKSQRK
jgi:DNA-binding Xre family transcriptional regulator